MKQYKSSIPYNAPRFPKVHCLLEGSQGSPVCPSGKSNMYNLPFFIHTVYEKGYGALVEWFWQGKTEVLGEKHVQVPYSPPYI